MKNPNILFIQVDQMTALALAAYGNPFCVSPNLDALAKNGVVFENAYCNFPLCAPSRFSMAAGQLCSAIGAYDNAAEFAAEIPTYAHYLRRAGYRTSLSGKMHFIGPDQYHGFEERLTADLYPADFSWVPNWGNEGKRDTNDPRSVLVSGLCESSKQIEFDEEVTAKAVQYLHDRAKDNGAQPFFLQVSYTHPHEPYLCREEFWNLYEDRPVPLPTTGPLTEDEHDPHAVRLLKDFGMFEVDFAEQDVLRARRAYFGSISYIDSLVGRLLTALQENGMAERTAIVFTSDHGDMLGERGMWFKKHFYEHSLRVPLFLQAPWVTPQRRKEMVSLVDLLPTFNGLATGSLWQGEGEVLAGSDLTALLKDGETDTNRTVYAEYLAEATPAPLFMIRRGGYKFIFSSHDGNMLFDVEKDPHERNNLAEHADYKEVAQSFADEVRQKWNESTLTEQILVSQKRRALVRDATKSGGEVRWNHGEQPGDAVRWYRGKEGYNEWAFNYTPVAGT